MPSPSCALDWLPFRRGSLQPREGLRPRWSASLAVCSRARLPCPTVSPAGFLLEVAAVVPARGLRLALRAPAASPAPTPTTSRRGRTLAAEVLLAGSGNIAAGM